MTTTSIDEKDTEDQVKDTSEEKPKKVSVAVRLVALARKAYDFGTDTSGKPFAVRKGRHVVIPLLGSKQSLRKELGGYFYEISGFIASQTALTEAMEILGYEAERAGDPVPVYMRSAIVDGVIYIDVGDKAERVIKVTANGWEVLGARADIPLLFRRTDVNAALPTPTPGGDLDLIWDYVNLSADRDRQLIKGWLAAAVTLVGTPCPILALLGEQGAAKTSGARRLFSLFDPSEADVRRPPSDVDELMHSAIHSRSVIFDNLSSIPRWMSDGLCRAVTGEANVDRSLYTDDSARIIQVRGVVGFTGIDVGALAGDLAERCVWANLSPMSEEGRRSERDLNAAWAEAYPSMVGGLLDLVVKVLDKSPEVDLERLPRMADFAEVLAAMDLATGSSSLAHYTKAQASVAEEIVDTDAFLVELSSKILARWTGTGSELHNLLQRPEGEKYWPEVRGIAGKLKRVAPDLRKVGWTVEEVERDQVSKRSKIWTLIPPGAAAVTDDELVGVDVMRDFYERDLASWERTVHIHGATRECMASHAKAYAAGGSVSCQEKGCKLEWQPEFKLRAARSKVIVEKLLNELTAAGLTYSDFERLVVERGLKAS